MNISLPLGWRVAVEGEGARATPSAVRCATAVVLLLTTPLVTLAQNSTAPAPTFTAQSELVLVPVVVTDGRGQHIAGLSKEAFRLEQDGHAQTLRIFEEVRTEKADKNAVARAPGFANLRAHDQRARRLTIVVLDTINTPAALQEQARGALIKYLSKSITADEPITLIGLNRSGLKQLHSFTTDTRVLIAALRRLKSRMPAPDIGEDDVSADLVTTAIDPGADELASSISTFLQNSIDDMRVFYRKDATRRTLMALNQIANAYHALAGRKTLVWATAGFPFMLNDPNAFGRMGTDMVEHYERTWRTLMSANIAVYPVDVAGLVPHDMGRPFVARSDPRPPAPISSGGRGPSLDPRSGDLRGRGSFPAVQYDEHRQKLDTMRAFAEATGGKPCISSNDLARCFERAVDDARSYYLLGFYLNGNDRKPGWRKLKVRVAADGAHIRTREGFYASPPPKDDEEARKLALESALASPIEFTGVHMDVQWTSRGKIKNAETNAVEAISTGFDLRLPPNSFTINRASGGVDLLLAAVVFDGNGKPLVEMSRTVRGDLSAEQVAKIDAGGYTYRDVIKVPARATEVRFVVRDNLSGEIGSVFAPVEAAAKFGDN